MAVARRSKRPERTRKTGLHQGRSSTDFNFLVRALYDAVVLGHSRRGCLVGDPQLSTHRPKLVGTIGVEQFDGVRALELLDNYHRVLC